MDTTVFSGVRVERECAACADVLDHCHGALITHVDGVLECTEAHCQLLDVARHELRMECVELADCDCVMADEEFAFAS